MTMENLLRYGPAQYDLVSNFLAFGANAHLAGLVYFLLVQQRLAPRYQMGPSSRRRSWPRPPSSSYARC